MKDCKNEQLIFAKNLKDLELTENQYHELQLKDEDELSLKDCVGVSPCERFLILDIPSSYPNHFVPIPFHTQSHHVSYHFIPK